MWRIQGAAQKRESAPKQASRRARRHLVRVNVKEMRVIAQHARISGQRLQRPKAQCTRCREVVTAAAAATSSSLGGKEAGEVDHPLDVARIRVERFIKESARIGSHGRPRLGEEVRVLALREGGGTKSASPASCRGVGPECFIEEHLSSIIKVANFMEEIGKARDGVWIREFNLSRPHLCNRCIRIETGIGKAGTNQLILRNRTEVSEPCASVPEKCVDSLWTRVL